MEIFNSWIDLADEYDVFIDNGAEDFIKLKSDINNPIDFDKIKRYINEGWFDKFKNAFKVADDYISALKYFKILDSLEAYLYRLKRIQHENDRLIGYQFMHEKVNEAYNTMQASNIHSVGIHNAVIRGKEHMVNDIITNASVIKKIFSLCIRYENNYQRQFDRPLINNVGIRMRLYKYLTTLKQFIEEIKSYPLVTNYLIAVGNQFISTYNTWVQYSYTARNENFYNRTLDFILDIDDINSLITELNLHHVN